MTTKTDDFGPFFFFFFFFFQIFSYGFFFFFSSKFVWHKNFESVPDIA